MVLRRCGSPVRVEVREAIADHGALPARLLQHQVVDRSLAQLLAVAQREGGRAAAVRRPPGTGAVRDLDARQWGPVAGTHPHPEDFSRDRHRAVVDRAAQAVGRNGVRGGGTQDHRAGAAGTRLQRRRRTAVDQDPACRTVGPEAVRPALHRSCRVAHFPAPRGGREQVPRRHRQAEGGRQSGQRDAGQVGDLHGDRQRVRGGVRRARHGDFRALLETACFGGDDADPVPGRRRRRHRLQVDGVQAQVIVLLCAGHDSPGSAVQQGYAAAGGGPGDGIDRHRAPPVRPPLQARRQVLDARLVAGGGGAFLEQHHVLQAVPCVPGSQDTQHLHLTHELDRAVEHVEVAAIVMPERHHAADGIGAERELQAAVGAMLVVHHHADPAPAGVVVGAVEGVPEAVRQGGRKAGAGEAARPVHAAVGIGAGQADVGHQAVQVLGGVGAEAEGAGRRGQSRNAVRLGDVDQRQLFHGCLACRGRHAVRQGAVRRAEFAGLLWIV